MSIEAISHADVSQFGKPIKEMVEKYDANKALAGIALGARQLETAAERDAFFREPYEGHESAPPALTAKPRFVAYLALGLIEDARLIAEKHFDRNSHALRSHFLDLVKAFFIHPQEAEERLNICFWEAIHAGRNDDHGPDSPRERIRSMLSELCQNDSPFRLTNGGHFATVWTPVWEAIRLEAVRGIVNF